MKLRKKSIFIPAICLLLTSCGGGGVSSVESFEPLEEEFIESIKGELDIPFADGIYGNIYLPEEIEGATITWESDDYDVIYTDVYENIKPGMVTRLAEDTTVKLKAIIEKDGKKGFYEQEVVVKGLEYEIQEDDYEGYLFGHFIGEGAAGQEQMYFALAENGLNFKDMNNKKPVLESKISEMGIRDPYLFRSPEGDTFYIVATNLSIYNRGGWGSSRGQSASKDGEHTLIMWKSHDLVNWDDAVELLVAPSNAGMAWAPEMAYNEETGEYVIFFASSLVNEDRTEKIKPDTIYYVTTRDFVHISEPKVMIDNQNDPDGVVRIMIDASVIKIGDYYYSAVKDGDNNVRNGGIRIFKNDDLLNSDGWNKLCDLDELGLPTDGLRISKFDNGSLEGPEFFKLNKKDWADPDVPEYCLMADQYMANAGYLPLRITDIEDNVNANKSWTVMSSKDYSFDTLKKRHGTVLKITAKEIERIKEAYPNK
ncbi:MAG: glycoside hydrolase family 43 protein [Bacillales bacterium]|nr:glycoside hydrolase family 43 protein [Bacillales bacterium]